MQRISARAESDTLGHSTRADTRNLRKHAYCVDLPWYSVSGFSERLTGIISCLLSHPAALMTARASALPNSVAPHTAYTNTSLLQEPAAVQSVVFTDHACNRTEPALHCPCTPEQKSGHGTCSAGLICTAFWDPTSATQHIAANATPRCWPCAFGQYCPLGSSLNAKSSALPAEVEKYTCRYILQSLPCSR